MGPRRSRGRPPLSPPRKTTTVQVGLHLSAELWARVRAAAEADDEYLNRFVETALERALAERKEARNA